MAEQVSGRVRLPKGFDSQAESIVSNTLVIQQGALEFPDGTFFTSSIDTTAFVTTSSFNAFTATYNTGSFSGSFRGDGSQLTGIVATVNTSSLVTTSSFNAFTASINSFTASYSTGSFTGSFTGSLLGTGSWAMSASQAVSASYSDRSQTTSTITINSFSSDVESYLLMSNVVALPGVGIGGDSDLRYNSITNKLSVGSVSATSLTGSLLGTASYADTLDGLDSTAFAQLSAQNIYTETNTFGSVTYYQADAYKAGHIAIVPTLGTNGDTIEVFNIYSLVPYIEVDEGRNCTAIFTYNIEDITTSKTVRGGQVIMVWSPTHNTYSTLVDTNAIVYGGDVTFNITDDYTLGSEYVKLTMTNNSGGNVYVRGLLTIT